MRSPVQAIDGAVILRGTVGSLVQQVEAARTARRVMGVQSVQDQLQVRPMGPDGRADADTQACVRNRLKVLVPAAASDGLRLPANP